MSTMSCSKPVRRRVHLIPLVLLSLAACNAQAEQVSALSDSTTDIRLRQESVQWVPESVTVIDKADLDSSYFRTLEDLQGFAPGLIIDGLSGTPQGAAISMRGIGSSETEATFEPAVAVLVDGVYVGSHAGQMQVLFDFEKVEINRGPNTTYQGAPNIGGTINLQRSKPSGNLGADIRASFGDHDRRELDGIFNFPITGQLAGKLALSTQEGGGDYMGNVTRSRSENSRDRVFVSASFLWQPSDRLSLQYSYDNENDRSDTPALLNVSTATDLVCINATAGETCRSTIGPAIPQTLSFNRTAQNGSNIRSYKGNYHTLRIDYDWGDHDLVSISAIRTNEEMSHQDLDATQIDFYSVSRDLDYDQFSQEFRISRQYSDRLHYTAGLYYLNTQSDLAQEEAFVLNKLGTAGLGDLHAVNDIQLLDSNTDSTLTSFFAHASYALDDQWTIDLGSRLSLIQKDFKHSPSGIRNSTTTTASSVNFKLDDEWNEWTFSTGISYKVDEAAMIYLRFSEGYRPGGFNTNGVSVESADNYDTETSQNWELGMKSDWLDDKLRLNMVYYQIDHDNKREQFIRAVGPGRVESVIDNVSFIEVDGFELEFELVPFENFKLRGTYSHMNANYLDYEIPDLANPGINLNFTALSANRAPFDSYHLSALYSFNFAEGTINAYARYQFYDDYQTNPQLNLARVNNYTNWDLSLDYVWQDWTFRLFSQNVNDSRHLRNVVNVTDGDVSALRSGATSSSGLITYAEYNQPRYTGFEIVYRPDLTNLFQ